MLPLVGTGLPVAVCEGRELTKKDVGRWVVRTRPNSSGTDWSFSVCGSTIEEWKNQVVKVVALKRGQLTIEDREGHQYHLDEERSQDAGWLTLEEFKDRKMTYMSLSYETFIKETKKLDKSDEGKTFVRVKPFGLMDKSFMPYLPKTRESENIQWNSVVVKEVRPNRVTILPYFGFNTVLKDNYVESDGWVELSVFQAALIKKGFKL